MKTREVPSFAKLLYCITLCLVLFSISLSSLAVVDGPFVPLLLLQHEPKSAFPETTGRCAINFYGLPRAFKSLVLPSLELHVIRPNAHHRCDYFVHFHALAADAAARDGRRGTVSLQDIYLLRDSVHRIHREEGFEDTPLVVFQNTTEAEFWNIHGGLVQKIKTERDLNGNLIYMPYKHPSYKNASIENVIKMWHSQTSVWTLMERSNNKNHITTHDAASGRMERLLRYQRVAMLRSDVVYVTPFDIYERSDGIHDTNNHVAIVPHFARHPVNDRMMYGPYEAVKIWASERISRLPQHGLYVQQHAPGDGIHSERYLNATIFPAIRQAGYLIQSHPRLCFLRARADDSVRFSDCGKPFVTPHNQQVVEAIIQRSCHMNTAHMNRDVVLLECAEAFHSSLNATNRFGPESLPQWQKGCDPQKRTRRRWKNWFRKPPECLAEHTTIFAQSK